MSNPSRHDISKLLCGNGGLIFNNFCLRPELNVMQCDVRLLNETEPFLFGTKAILILGEKAMHTLLPETAGNSLNEMRGSLFYYKNIPTICSYLPQNAVDIYKDYESENNILAQNYNPDDALSPGDDEDEEEGDVKRHGRTKRTNYSFWLRKDVQKCKQLLVGFKPPTIKASYKIWPPSHEIIRLLSSTKGQHLYLDLETDYEELNIQCFSFSFDGSTIYCVPILDYNYLPAYPDYYLIFRALSVGIRDNIVVAHNGAGFDFLVLTYKYHIAIKDSYDTLIAAHRCYPDVEKSLGHQTSLWTWEKFHKDEDSIGYRTQAQMMDRLRYCGKDVFTMYLIKQAIDEYAKTIPGLVQSISDAMDCIRPYLIATLAGIKVDQELVNQKVQENDRLMVQYNRIIEYFIGPVGLEDIRGRKKLGMFAGSNPQCCKYFHEMLDYQVVGRGKPDITGHRNPSLGKKALYKLALKYENPIINMICAYRQVKKETGRLRFLTWDFKRYCGSSSDIKPSYVVTNAHPPVVDVSTTLDKGATTILDSTQWVIPGTKTFRLGSRALFKKKRLIHTGEVKERGLGGNIQNIEKEMREIYIPKGFE